MDRQHARQRRALGARERVVAAVTGLSLLVLPAGSASADSNTAASSAIAAVGGDGLVDDYVEFLSRFPALTADVANYGAGAERVVDTALHYPGPATRPATADCVISLPRNESEGRQALSAAMTGASLALSGPEGSENFSGCAAVARSTSTTFPAGSGPGSVARVPFVVDAITPAVSRNSAVPRKLTFTLLANLYARNGQAGTAACLNLTPLLPAHGSAVRAFWATALGVVDYDFSGSGGEAQDPPPPGVPTWGSCVTGGSPNTTGVGTGSGSGNPGDRKGGPTGTPIPENDGRFVDAGTQLIPYSTLAWLGQAGQFLGGDIRGVTTLASVDFTSTTTAAAEPNLRHPTALNAQAAATLGFRGPLGSLNQTVHLYLPRSLVDPGYAVQPDQTAFRTPAAADVSRFRQAFVGGTSDLCAAAHLGRAPDCGTPTYGP